MYILPILHLPKNTRSLSDRSAIVFILCNKMIQFKDNIHTKLTVAYGAYYQNLYIYPEEADNHWSG